MLVFVCLFVTLFYTGLNQECGQLENKKIMALVWTAKRSALGFTFGLEGRWPGLGPCKCWSQTHTCLKSQMLKTLIFK